MVAIFTDHQTAFDVLYILALMLSLRNQYYPPVASIIPHLNDTTIGNNTCALDKKSLPQSWVYPLQRFIDFLFW